MLNAEWQNVPDMSHLNSVGHFCEEQVYEIGTEGLDKPHHIKRRRLQVVAMCGEGDGFAISGGEIVVDAAQHLHGSMYVRRST